MGKATKIMLGVGIGCVLSGSLFSGAAVAFSPDLLQTIGMPTPRWSGIWENVNQKVQGSFERFGVDMSGGAMTLKEMEEVAEEYVMDSENKVKNDVNSWEEEMENWGASFELRMSEWEEHWRNEWENEAKNQSELEGYQELKEGDLFSGVQELDVEVSKWKVSVIADSSVEEVTIMKYETQGHQDLKIKQKGNTIKIYDPEIENVVLEDIRQSIKEGKELLFPDETALGKLEIHVPAETPYETFDFNIERGEFWVNGVALDELDLTLAGRGELLDCVVNDLDAEIVGNFSYTGSIDADVDLECVASEIHFLLEGKKSDFQYDFQCVAGEVTLDGEKKNGTVFEIKTEEKSSKKFDVDSVASNMDIAFQ